MFKVMFKMRLLARFRQIQVRHGFLFAPSPSKSTKACVPNLLAHGSIRGSPSQKSLASTAGGHPAAQLRVPGLVCEPRFFSLFFRAPAQAAFVRTERYEMETQETREKSQEFEGGVVLKVNPFLFRWL